MGERSERDFASASGASATQKRSLRNARPPAAAAKGLGVSPEAPGVSGQGESEASESTSGWFAVDSRRFVKRGRGLREIHRASECALQGLLRPIASRGEANLVSPRGFQKVNPLTISVLAKINPRGEFHETSNHPAWT